MGAQRVLAVVPQLSAQREMDALDLTAACLRASQTDGLPENTVLLRVPLPPEAGALSLNRVLACVQAGEETARTELDRLLEELGMAHCRVLPFRRSL